jgi:L-alanine-DL-glutamate epimerase-like enolase superfamily enzyme
MAEIVERLVMPHVIGNDSDDVAAVWERAFRGSAIVGRVGLVRRALGLVDIALWDLATKRAGRPLWDSLGTTDAPRSAMLVAAYPTSGKTVIDVVDEVLTQAEEGWPLVKISRSSDARFMADVVTALTRELPDRTKLVVDASFGWRDADQAIAEVRSWGDVQLGWLEDPLLPEDIEGCARLRKESGMIVASGDEVTDPRLLRALVEGGAVDVMRLDVVAIGGITPAIELIAWARERGVRVSGHVYPEVTVHLGIDVETFNRSASGNPYDPAPTFISDGPTFVSGAAHVPREPGLGFGLSSDVFDLRGVA